MRALGTTARHLLNSVATLPWLAPKNKLGGLSPSAYADFGRDKYALAGVGPNLVSNGDFSSGATGWTADAIVSFSGGAASFAAGAAGAGMYCTLSGVSVGDIISVTYTVPTYVAGQVRASLEGGRGLLRTAGGMYTEIIAAPNVNPRLFIQGVAGSNTFSITNIIARKVTTSLGPELVQNGTFNTGISGWTDASTAPGAVTWSSGAVTHSSDGTNAARLRQAIYTIPGRTYLVSSTGTAVLFVGTTPGGSNLLGGSNAKTRAFVAAGTSTHLGTYSTTNGETLDNVSVREVLVGFGPELVTNGGFDNDLSGWTDASAAGASMSWVNGRAVGNTDGTTIARLRSSFPTVIGRTYRIAVAGTGGILVGTVAGTSDITSVVGGEKTFVATTATTYISYTNSVNGLYLDFVSAREVLTNQPARSVTFAEMFLLSSGAKTIVANDNLLKTVPANNPAFDYSSKQRRLRLEGAVTQLAPYSNALNLWGNGSGGVSAVQNATDPFGVANSAWTLTQTGATGIDARLQVNVPVTSSTLDYCGSIFIKKTTGAPTAFPALTCWSVGGGGTLVCVVNTTTGEILSNTTAGRFGIEEGGNGFWRVFVVAANFSNTTMVLQIYPSWASSFTLTKSTPQGGSVVVFGGMMAQESGLSSYIPSSGTQVTRVTDVCAFSPLLNLCLVTQAMTMAYRGNIKTLVAGQALIGLLTWGLLRGGGGGPSSVLIDGSSSVTINIGAPLPGEVGIAFGWDTGSVTGTYNGVAPTTNTNALDKQKPPFYFGHSTGMAAGTIHALGSFVAWPLKGSNSNIQQQARVYA